MAGLPGGLLPDSAKCVERVARVASCVCYLRRGHGERREGGGEGQFGRQHVCPVVFCLLSAGGAE